MKKLFTLFFFLMTVVFNSTAQDCDPATITNVEREGTGNRITWKMPLGGKEVVISHSEEFINSAGDKSSFGLYHRFTPNDLISVDAGTLNQVAFVPTKLDWQPEPGHTYTIQIYKGGVWGNIGNRCPGSLISNQELNNNNLIFNQENTITLETKVIVDALQELWIGFFCTNIDSIETTAKHPAGRDNGPCKDGFGNIMFYNNQWNTLCEIQSDYSDLNWCIKGKVLTIDGLTVNIYHNNNSIETEFSGTSYFHNNPTGEEHCYQVEANCLEGGVSLLSNEVCIPGVGIEDNVQNNKFTVYPNPACNELRITNYELRNGLQSEVEVEIYDIYGRKQSHGSRVTSHEITIDVSTLSPGVYFIRLIEDNHSYMQRFIKH